MSAERDKQVFDVTDYGAGQGGFDVDDTEAIKRAIAASMSEIKPALTAEEWLNAFDKEGCPVFNFDIDEDGLGRGLTATIRGGDRHRFAAACLHGQPFGFTREDVFFLRDLEQVTENSESLADRIEALLPLEET